MYVIFGPPLSNLAATTEWNKGRGGEMGWEETKYSYGDNYLVKSGDLPSHLWLEACTGLGSIDPGAMR